LQQVENPVEDAEQVRRRQSTSAFYMHLKTAISLLYTRPLFSVVTMCCSMGDNKVYMSHLEYCSCSSTVTTIHKHWKVAGTAGQHAKRDKTEVSITIQTQLEIHHVIQASSYYSLSVWITSQIFCFLISILIHIFVSCLQVCKMKKNHSQIYCTLHVISI